MQLWFNTPSLKLKLEELRTEALQVRGQIDVLFSDESVSEDEIARLKEGFKVLKAFAQANLRYGEARSQAEEARAVLDKALQPPSSQLKPDKLN